MFNIKLYYRIFKSKSIRYILFRSKHFFERKVGILALKFPVNPKPVRLPSLIDWKNSSSKYLFADRKSIDIYKHITPQSEVDTKRILNGDIKFFSNVWFELGLNYDWVTNPSTGFKYDLIHWTKIESIDEEAGDIKFTWEPSRFCFLYTIIRYDYNFNADHSEWVINRILDWIEHNPINCGPNYKCSQEISLRVLNWLFALNFYKDSVSLTDEKWDRIITSLYWQIHHVYYNINYSLLTVRNNHAITETLTLYIIGLLFPSFPKSKKMKRFGKRRFEQEIEYQFEPDGSYLQNSMNYQRVVTQLLTLGIALADKNNEIFKNFVYDRAYANINFLYQCMDEKTGMLPNYGSNDGALFFPWHDSDYCDFRPQILDLESLLLPKGYAPLKKQEGVISFKNGGYYLISNRETLTFFRCGSYKQATPADQLHIDVWYKGENVLMDAGSYMYNTEEKIARYFSGSESHNTLLLGINDQMLKGPRFMWFFPPTIVGVDVSETTDYYEISGQIVAFKQVKPDISVVRTVRKYKDMTRWEITDKVDRKPSGIEIRQIWHTKSDCLKIYSNGKRKDKIGYYSRYYGSMKENRQIEFLTDNESIITIIELS